MALVAVVFGMSIVADQPWFAAQFLPTRTFGYWLQGAVVLFWCLVCGAILVFHKKLRDAQLQRGEDVHRGLDEAFLEQYEHLMKQENRWIEEVLGANVSKMRSLLEKSPAGIALLSPDGKFRYLGPSTTRLLGYAKSDLLARYFLDMLHPGDRMAAQSFIDDCMSQPFKVLTGQFRFKLKDGSWIAQEWIGANFLQDLDVQGILLLFRPVPEKALAGQILSLDERRHLEEQLRRAQHMEAIGQLAGGLAHEVNNMLTVIQGHGNFLLQKIGPTDPLFLSVETIQKAAERTSSLIRQLLTLARKQELTLQVFNLNNTIAEIDRMLRPLVGKKIEVVAKLDPNLGEVRADPAQIEQVILNLALNARDAMPNGGQLIIETANAELDKAYARMNPDILPGPYVLLVVSDSGCGMTEEVQSHIFEPLFSTKDPGKGSGLGLSNVSGIVKQTNGHIKVFSIPGHGSTFRIYLPRHQEAPALVSAGN
jgi:PAS domain S-box-containing protein